MMERFGGEGKKRSVGVEIEAKPMKGWGGKKKRKSRRRLGRGAVCAGLRPRRPRLAFCLLARSWGAKRRVRVRRKEKRRKRQRREGAKGRMGAARQRGGGEGAGRKKRKKKRKGKKRIREGGSAAQGGKNKGEAKPRPAPFVGLSAL